MTSRDYFKNKRVAVIGLGHHGEMVEDVKFLIKSDAIVSVYDIKSEARLKNHLVFLRSIGLANYVCGSVPEDDLLDMDIIILSREYSKDAGFLRAINAGSKKILVEYPETLFFKQAPPVTVVGVMGAHGKSSLISMLKPLLQFACSSSGEQKFFVIDPESNDGILTHLKRIKSGDVVLARIDGLVSKELHAMRLSPQVAVFASLPSDELNGSPFESLSYQTYNNFIVASDEIIDMTHHLGVQPRAKMLRTRPTMVVQDRGSSQRYRVNEKAGMALAFQTASLFKVDEETAKDILAKWKPLHGRLEPVKKIKGIEFYNDSASVSPEATRFAIRTLSDNKNIVLIMGGAKSDSQYDDLYKDIPDHVHTIVLLPGSGTILERRKIHGIPGIDVKSVPTMDEAVRIAFESAKKGDIVLFSPGFQSVGIDVSRKERGERFVKAVRNL